MTDSTDARSVDPPSTAEADASQAWQAPKLWLLGDVAAVSEGSKVDATPDAQPAFS
jgi:hypothetical protein